MGRKLIWITRFDPMRLVVASANVGLAAPGDCERYHDLGASVADRRADATFPQAAVRFSSARGNDATAAMFSYRFYKQE
ncbi:MAG TPA: hypothetical protein VFY87_19090 [Geminicoccaceae bacterium]|nr:hypothetical protein [Geminicoccaceae bacterium]